MEAAVQELYAIYDLECLKNCFTAGFIEFNSGKEIKFVIHSSRNDFKPLMQFLKMLKRKGYIMVGYNNISYDMQLLEYLIDNYFSFENLKASMIVEKLYALSTGIINLPDEEKFRNLIPEWKLSITQLDLRKQRHYDAKGKMVSLKWLEFSMRFDNIQGMPIHHSTWVTPDMIDTILEYNINDVRATRDFFRLVKFETDLRLQLSEEYNLNLLNASEPKLGREIFGKFMSEAMGITYRELKEMRTQRSIIHGKEVMFKYVNFTDPILNGAKDFFKKLSFNPYMFEDNNMGLVDVEKTFSYHNLKEVVIGLGGIHACISPGVYQSSGTWMIRDLDGKSYYPNLAIQNGFFPAHLSAIFLEVFKNLYDQRAEIPKDSPVNYIYKIILNAAYGQSKEPNNFMHDPKFTFTITINGQLLLLMLAEMCKNEVPGLIFYQFNTDGITVGYDTKHEKKLQDVMKKWQELTKIELEDKFYQKMVIANVNNYIALDKDGKAKRKGAMFAYSMDPKDRELDYHKNPSRLIVPKALEQYFLYGVPIEKTVKESTDIFDFCHGVKLTRDFDLLKYELDPKTHKIEKTIIHENVVRYYISKSVCSLKKKHKPGSKNYGKKPTEIQKGWNMTLYNTHTLKEIADYNIDYRFYLSKIRKIIRAVEGDSLNQLKINF